MTWARRTATGWELRLHVQPGAKKSGTAGLHGESLKLRVNAPPVDGKANEAVIAYLALRLGVPKRAVRITGGETSREKRVAIDAPEADPATLVD